MKKLLLMGLCLMLIGSGRSGAQEKKTELSEPIRPALMVIDVQNAFLPYMEEKERQSAIMVINHVIGLFREYNHPVIRIYHTDPDWGPKPGTEGFEFPASILVKPEDPKIIKNYPNAFKKTDLIAYLKEHRINCLFLAGFNAVGCVLATYQGAEDLDIQVFMLKQGLIAHDPKYTPMVQELCSTMDARGIKLILKSLASQVKK
ncbi:MAG: isochorismatase family protein [Candidatus Delongbacteria bacterium]|nr:isochorismatase family protein [Candidatus Delongbacteria bacterium]